MAYSIQQIFDFGFLTKIIIRRTKSLKEQIRQFSHNELKRLIAWFFENYNISSLTLIIKSIMPTYKGIAQGAKHFIEIHTSPKFTRSIQLEDEHVEYLSPEDAEESIENYRMLMISQFKEGFSRPSVFMYPIFQDKELIIFCHEKKIKGKVFAFQFYTNNPNRVEEIQAMSTIEVLQTGDYNPTSRVQEVRTPVEDMEPFDPDLHQEDWMDEIELANLDNRMEA